MVLRWGVTGTGFITETMVAAIRTSPDSEVVAASGRDPERVAGFAAEHDIPRNYVGLDAMLADHNVDIVYIGLPNHLHADAAIAAANAGKAILCEKSLTTTLDTAHAVVEAAERNGTFLAEGLMYLAHPFSRRVFEVLADGRLGTLRSFTARYAAAIAHLANPLGMGTIYNLGCYPVSTVVTAAQVLGLTEALDDRTSAAVGTYDTEHSILVEAALAMRFGDDIVATVHASDRHDGGFFCSITGDGGTLDLQTNPWLPEAGESAAVWRPADLSAEPEWIVVTSDHDAFHHQVRAIETVIAAGQSSLTSPLPTLATSLQTMAILTEWEAAARATG